MDKLPLRRNLELLSTYRDNAVHFYNAKGFGTIIYSLAQTSIINLKDLLEKKFAVRLEEEISWHLLPIGLNMPVDPVSYLTSSTGSSGRKNAAVQQFLKELAQATQEVEAAGSDTGRLLTVFSVKLESTKKIESADAVVGVAGGGQGGGGPLVVSKRVDPNISHPLRQKDVVQKVVEAGRSGFTTYTFQAVAWRYGLKDQPHLCWKAEEGTLTKYANDIVPYILRLSEKEIQNAVQQYKNYLAGKRKKT